MPTKTSHGTSELTLSQVLGSRIKELREGRGWSQRTLSQELRISKSMVAKYEGGVHAPTVHALVRLASLFGVSLDSLMGQDVRDPRLVRCLRKIQDMDEGSRVAVVDAIEGIVHAYAMLFERGEAEGPR